MLFDVIRPCTLYTEAHHTKKWLHNKKKAQAQQQRVVRLQYHFIRFGDEKRKKKCLMEVVRLFARTEMSKSNDDGKITTKVMILVLSTCKNVCFE